MTTRNDTEAISAYLDGNLSPRDRERLETRLKREPELQAELDALDRTRSLLRAAPQYRAPRNFTLTPEMAGAQAEKPGVLFGLSRLAFTLTTILFVVALVGNFSFKGLGGLPPQAAAVVTEEADLAMAPLDQSAPPDSVRSAGEEGGAADTMPMEAQSVESGEATAEGESFDPGTEVPSIAIEESVESQPAEDPIAEGTVTSEAADSMQAVEPAVEPEIAAADGDLYSTAPEAEPQPEQQRINPWSIFAVLTGAAALLSGGLTLALRKR